MDVRRLIIGLTGASGTIYGVRLLQVLSQRPNLEVHLVMTGSAALTLRLENPEWALNQVHKLAQRVHRPGDIAAPIASGSFAVDSMVIIPCSMKTVSALAHGYSDNLLTRSADVMLKERRRLIVVPRETPLHSVHLRNLLAISELGGLIVPPVPAFYHRPTSIAELVDHLVGKVLSLLGLEQDLFPAWLGPQAPTEIPAASQAARESSNPAENPQNQEADLEELRSKPDERQAAH